MLGARVDLQLILSFRSATKPSKHSQTHSLPAFTAIVELMSQPCEPSPQGWSVGMCVGTVVGAKLVGANVGSGTGALEGCVVGSFVDSGVGCSVGAEVIKQCVLSLVSATKPSKHWQWHISPSSTAIVVSKSQPWLPSSQGCSVGMCEGDIVGASLVGSNEGAVDGSSV
jgi:hypothetical protein